MTVGELLQNYTYNTYTDPLDLYDADKNDYIGSTKLLVKINGIYTDYNTTFKRADDSAEDWDDIKDLVVKEWSVQIRYNKGLQYAIAIITE